MPGWREISRSISFILLFGVIAWNLYAGADVLDALFRGFVAMLAFSILDIIITNRIVKVLSDLELRRLRQMQAEEMFSEREEEEPKPKKSTQKAAPAETPPAPEPAQQTQQASEEAS